MMCRTQTLFTDTITFNRTLLLRLLAMVCEMVGVEAGGSVAALPRRVHLAVLSLLRPLEFALRRLIVAEARGVIVKTPNGAGRSFPAGGFLAGSGERAPLFSLFDPWPRVGGNPPQRFAKHEPRIFTFGWDDYGPERADPVEPAAPSPDVLVNAVRLCRRLEALQIALADLPKQAKRLARAQSRRRNAPPGSKRVPPMRPGWPPGLRIRNQREVDRVLRECHILAVRALAAPDTS